MKNGTHWSAEEDDKLTVWWGEFTLSYIAKRLERSEEAIAMRAKALELGSPNAGTLSMNELARQTGYSLSRIQTAIKQLGLVLRWGHRQSSSQQRFPKRLAITEEQREQIVEYLRKIPDSQPLFSDEADRLKTSGGKWGVGRKAASCQVCGRSDRPYYAKDRCASCYMVMFRTKSHPRQLTCMGGGRRLCRKASTKVIYHHPSRTRSLTCDAHFWTVFRATYTGHRTEIIPIEDWEAQQMEDKLRGTHMDHVLGETPILIDNDIQAAE